MKTASIAGIFPSFVLALAGCSVTTTSLDTGGVGGEGNETSCDGIAIVLGDDLYTSSQVALADGKGKTLSESLISTASTTTDGLAFPLSGDVVLPSTKPPEGELVLIDRLGTNVITWIDVKSGEVRAQLPVGETFDSNPLDYMAINSKLAVVSRREPNYTPGGEDFDDGGDVVFIDPSKPKILGNVVMPTEGDYPANPSNLSLVDGDLFVTLERVAADWSSTAEARIVPVNTADMTAGEPIKLAGLKGCGGLVVTPDEKELAIACTGALDSDGAVEGLNQSAIVFFDRSKRPLEETRRIAAKDIAGEPIQNQFAYASDDLILVKTQTTWGGDKNNRLVAYDLSSKKATTLTEAEPDSEGKGLGLTLGTIVCQPGCNDMCLIPNASTGKLERVEIDGTKAKLLRPVNVETKVKLTPRSLGTY